MIIFSGNSNRTLAENVCRYLDVPLGKAIVSKFKDGETRVELQSNVRGQDVFIRTQCDLCRSIGRFE